MAVGFPALAKWSKDFKVEPTLLRQLVRRAIEKLDWRYETPEPGTFVAHIPSSISSWGEVVTIRVEEISTVEAESRGSWPTQIVDWGKNRSNLNAFHASLLHAIRNSELDTEEFRNNR